MRDIVLKKELSKYLKQQMRKEKKRLITKSYYEGRPTLQRTYQNLS